MNAHHPYHSAYRNLRTIKTPVVLRSKRRKWALSLTRKRLAAILLLYCALLAGPTVITAQTLQASRLASTASAENVLATARDNVEPNLSTARVPDHAAAGGSSFIKRAVRGVLRFTKSLFSAFGEGESSIRKVEPKSNDQDEVTIRSDATVDPPGFDRPEGSAKVLVNALPPKVADEGPAIGFEVDRKEVDQEFRVLLYADNKVYSGADQKGQAILGKKLQDDFIGKSLEKTRVTEEQAKPVRNLCDLVENWGKYHGHKVRVRAVYEVGRTWLYDPACRNGEALTYMSIQTDAKETRKRLEQSAGKNGLVWVTLEGIFYGPAPFENIDPRLPAKLREGLEKSHKRYGHLDSFDTMIKVTEIVKAAEL